MVYRKGMRWKNQMLMAAGLILAGSSVQAVPAAQLKENYQSIIERNPFGLKPPPPPPTNNIAPPEQKAKMEVFLTGITSIGHPRLPKQAYFYTREQGKKDVTYYALTEGTGKDGIHVLNIDPEKRKVKIKMENAETLLSFETHGVPIQAVAAGRPLPGVPGAPPLPMPGQMPQPGSQPNTMPGAAPTAMYDANGQPVYNTGGAVAQPLNAAGNQGSTGLRQIPSRRVRGGNQYNSGASVPTGPGGIGEGGTGMGQPQAVATDPAEEYVRAHLNKAAQAGQNPNIPPPPLPTIE
jgi:hypothetical protein